MHPFGTPIGLMYRVFSIRTRDIKKFIRLTDQWQRKTRRKSILVLFHHPPYAAIDPYLGAAHFLKVFGATRCWQNIHLPVTRINRKTGQRIEGA